VSTGATIIIVLAAVLLFLSIAGRRAFKGGPTSASKAPRRRSET
jgi:hypothetical protein